MENKNYIENRPWGKFEILAKFGVSPKGDVCVKIITVKPKMRLSYQSHKLRGEHWTFAQGRGTVILNDEPRAVMGGSCIYVPAGAKHRVVNDSEDLDLIFVEVSSGHFDENDIVRFEDDYGRVV